MFNSQTLFIIGAGASCEARLPTGDHERLFNSMAPPCWLNAHTGSMQITPTMVSRVLLFVSLIVAPQARTKRVVWCHGKHEIALRRR